MLRERERERERSPATLHFYLTWLRKKTHNPVYLGWDHFLLPLTLTTCLLLFYCFITLHRSPTTIHRIQKPPFDSSTCIAARSLTLPSSRSHRRQFVSPPPPAHPTCVSIYIRPYPIRLSVFLLSSLSLSLSLCPSVRPASRCTSSSFRQRDHDASFSGPSLTTSINGALASGPRMTRPQD
ncbi:hypothetical protein GGS23DRAFT_295277 [Durotheca rogersii]|uniref:uncharacterized protein n=1 Tax=Durotheca rogersii TaxID=419775 RepID=UPI00221F0296|nr:uncharacterized protein GGS23DRAFT_295277 [Durotheca rogersii]KAI5866909.1 hypothetical protein GGS23DRAFT_295277 [Durotheca rogersii]